MNHLHFICFPTVQINFMSKETVKAYSLISLVCASRRHYSAEFSIFKYRKISVRTLNNLCLFLYDLGIVILLSGMSTLVNCCIDWSTRKIILTLGRCENFPHFIILNKIAFVKRCTTLPLWGESDISTRPYSSSRCETGTSLRVRLIWDSFQMQMTLMSC